MIEPLSPLQEVTLEKYTSRFFLKREDMIGPVGGNKVRRFQAFFNQNPHLKKVVALSNPGSHTFKVLTAMLDDLEPLDFIFLEREMSLSPYERKNREAYINHPQIHVSQAPFWKQWLKWLYYKTISSAHTGVIGVGGFTSVRPNPFQQALKECDQQLRDNGVSGSILHLLPNASGQMLDGLLAESINSDYEHTFLGVMTGDAMTQPYLRVKYLSYKQVKLLKPRTCSHEKYTILANWFHRQTGVWLDPIHCVHSADVLHRETTMFPSATNTIVWVTCPLLTLK